MGIRSNYNNDIYKMLEETKNKNALLTKENRKLKLDYRVLTIDFNNLKNSMENKINIEVEKETAPLIKENEELHIELNNAYQEINRLKSQLESQDYKVDKLECQVNKDSTNSGIPTSKEIATKHPKTGANTYNL